MKRTSRVIFVLLVAMFIAQSVVAAGRTGTDYNLREPKGPVTVSNVDGYVRDTPEGLAAFFDAQVTGPECHVGEVTFYFQACGVTAGLSAKVNNVSPQDPSLVRGSRNFGKNVTCQAEPVVKYLTYKCVRR